MKRLSIISVVAMMLFLVGCLSPGEPNQGSSTGNAGQIKKTSGNANELVCRVGFDGYFYEKYGSIEKDARAEMVSYFTVDLTKDLRPDLQSIGVYVPIPTARKTHELYIDGVKVVESEVAPLVVRYQRSSMDFIGIGTYKSTGEVGGISQDLGTGVLSVALRGKPGQSILDSDLVPADPSVWSDFLANDPLDRAIALVSTPSGSKGAIVIDAINADCSPNISGSILVCNIEFGGYFDENYGSIVKDSRMTLLTSFSVDLEDDLNGSQRVGRFKTIPNTNSVSELVIDGTTVASAQISAINTYYRSQGRDSIANEMSNPTGIVGGITQDGNSRAMSFSLRHNDPVLLNDLVPEDSSVWSSFLTSEFVYRAIALRTPNGDSSSATSSIIVDEISSACKIS